MSHNIGKTADGRDALAFRGDRADIWHRLGNEHQDSWTVDDWAAASGLTWAAVKVPAMADLASLGLRPPHLAVERVPERHFVVRGDNGYVLSPNAVSDRYELVQPREALAFCQQYVEQDDRFQLDTAMCLKKGEIIAVTAVFNGDSNVCGEKHRARLLMTTTFDGSGATIAKATMTRVVCNNTLHAALADGGKSVISVRHNTRFDPKRVGAELAQIATGFASYKIMGEAMLGKIFTPKEVSAFFKATLDIDPNAAREEISKRKSNQFDTMVQAYATTTKGEGLPMGSAWSLLQSVTRYCDHDRSVSGSDGTPRDTAERRFVASNFGSGGGALMKAKAVQVLDEMSDHELLRAVSAATPPKAQRDEAADMAAFLSQPFKGSKG